MLTFDPYPDRSDFASPVWRDMRRLQEEMNSLVSRVTTRPTAYPAVNLWTGEDGVLVTAELPGVPLEELEISVVADTLTIKGNRPVDRIADSATQHRRERGSGRFARVVQLPFRIEADEVSAKMKNGLLNITLPRAHADRPRTIQVKGS